MKKPDWRKAEDYEFAKGLSLRDWAWEFLKRSKEYRKAYDDFASKSETYADEYGQDWTYNKACMAYDPPKGEAEDDKQWKKRVALRLGQNPRRIPLGKYIGRKYGLDGMFHYDSPAHEVVFLEPTIEPGILRKYEDIDQFVEDKPSVDGGGVLTLNQEFAVLVFDLTLSAESQTANLTYLLTELRKRRSLKKPQLPAFRSEWVRYLRVFDADFDNANEEEMAKYIWGPPELNDDFAESAKFALKNAKQWTKYPRIKRLLLRHLSKPD